MPKKKIKEEVKESEPVALLVVRAHQNFRDGAFSKDFKEYGYGDNWKAGETRLLPPNLFIKLQLRSGNKFSLGAE